MSDEVTITIDGKEVKTTSDRMLIQAANEAGVYIPYLCYHPGMKPYGACRMGVVEVEGAPGTPASCTLPVRDGMVVLDGAPGDAYGTDDVAGAVLQRQAAGEGYQAAVGVLNVVQRATGLRQAANSTGGHVEPAGRPGLLLSDVDGAQPRAIHSRERL